MVEQILADAARAHAIRVLSLRYFNPIGADPQLRTGPIALRRLTRSVTYRGLTSRQAVHGHWGGLADT